jgi:hypothetical protein
MWATGLHQLAIGAAAGLLAASACGRSQASTPTHMMAFWFEDDAFQLTPYVATRLGGAISEEEGRTIEQISRQELTRAFSGLDVAFATDRRGFWRVAVARSLPLVQRRQLPAAGQSLAFGIFGGVGQVDLRFAVGQAVSYAPQGAAREAIVEAIGRGIGRTAIHEFTHQILGTAFGDDGSDEFSYEYGRTDRESHYYGSLHWGPALPLLVEKVGARTP